MSEHLPPKVRILLSRADLSAREAIAVVCNNARHLNPEKTAYSVTIAGAADVNGRLAIMVGAWNIRFPSARSDRYIDALLHANGILSFTPRPTFGAAPRTFAMDGQWIDSTIAADVIKHESAPPAMGASCSPFFRLQLLDDTRLFWEVRRTGGDPSTGVLVTQHFGINASNGDIVCEAVEHKLRGVLVESWHRLRGSDGEWINKLDQ